MLATCTCIDFQFHNLKFSQKGILDFHVTTATVDLCLKEVTDKLLRIALWRKIIASYVDTLKAKILTIIVLNLVRKDISISSTVIFRGPSMT